MCLSSVDALPNEQGGYFSYKIDDFRIIPTIFHRIVPKRCDPETLAFDIKKHYDFTEELLTKPFGGFHSHPCDRNRLLGTPSFGDYKFFNSALKRNKDLPFWLELLICISKTEPQRLLKMPYIELNEIGFGLTGEIVKDKKFAFKISLNASITFCKNLPMVIPVKIR